MHTENECHGTFFYYLVWQNYWHPWKWAKKDYRKQIIPLLRYIVISQHVENILLYEWFNGIDQNKKIKIKKVSQLLLLVLGAASPCKDNGTEPISIMPNEFGEHIWRDLGPFLHAEPSRSISLGLRLWGFSGDWDGHCKTLIQGCQ